MSPAAWGAYETPQDAVKNHLDLHSCLDSAGRVVEPVGDLLCSSFAIAMDLLARGVYVSNSQSNSNANANVNANSKHPANAKGAAARPITLTLDDDEEVEVEVGGGGGGGVDLMEGQNSFFSSQPDPRGVVRTESTTAAVEMCQLLWCLAKAACKLDLSEYLEGVGKNGADAGGGDRGDRGEDGEEGGGKYSIGSLVVLLDLLRASVMVVANLPSDLTSPVSAQVTSGSTGLGGGGERDRQAGGGGGR